MQFYLEKEGIFVVEEQRGDITLLDSGKQLIDILDMEHPLIALSDSIDWESIQQDLSGAYPSETGRPNKPIRLMVGLHYLRYMFDLSDESIVWAYIENPYCQYFCGEKTFQHSFPNTDKGYPGHGYEGETTVIKESAANRKKYKHLKRRSSIEPVIGHMKNDHRLKRNFLKGTHGNQLNTVLSACGYNLKKIYNKFRKAFTEALFWPDFTISVKSRLSYGAIPVQIWIQTQNFTAANSHMPEAIRTNAG